MEENIKKIVDRWAENAIDDVDLINEYNSVKYDEEKLFDAFYRDLEFGTGGLRGVIGFGTNRMNVYVIRKATLGLARYLHKEYKDLDKICVAIGYDSRIKSDVFAKEAARVFAENDIHVFLYKQLLPVPTLSYAVRELKCQAGVMITASHNPSKYNGYKVYDENGCQITNHAADKILKEINAIDPFDVKINDFVSYLLDGKIEYTPDAVLDSFIERVKKESLLGNEKIDRNVKIVYSPLHGAGLVPVTRILNESGYKNVIVVEEQRLPDGNFTTCPYPNPEVREAMQLGIEYAKKNDADLLIATDPDCDRVGIAVKNGDDFVLLSGNQTGVLLVDYVCSMRLRNNTMPKDAYIVKTIVTTDMAQNIAESYGVRIHSVLTGFKYIGEYIKTMEDSGNQGGYIFGFEESYGYLSGDYVRDKDAVNGAYLICEMFAYYKTRGISLIDKLNELYAKYGYYLNTLDSFTFEGASGFEKMKSIMASFRKEFCSIGGFNVVKKLDYLEGIDGLVPANVIKFYTDNGSTITLRPSGTEPKLKLYCSIKAENEAKAKSIYNNIYDDLAGLLR